MLRGQNRLDLGAARIHFQLGAAFERIEFVDAQDFPNRIDVNMGPLVVVGVRFEF